MGGAADLSDTANELADSSASQANLYPENELKCYNRDKATARETCKLETNNKVTSV